jgi:broad specificity phosphatase PhoE
VALPADLAAHFRLRDDPEGARLPPNDETYAEGQRRVQAACDRMARLFGGQEKRILVVGHACNGARLIEGFMQIPKDGRFGHANTGMTEIGQKHNGDFVARYINRL